METTKRSVFDRLGVSRRPYFKNRVCSFWLAGNCTKNRCMFLHSNSSKSKQSYRDYSNNKFKCYLRNSNRSCSTSEADDVIMKKKKVQNIGNSGPVVQSKNATLPSYLEGATSEVNKGNVIQRKILAFDSTVESKKGRVSTSTGAPRSKVNINHVNQKKDLTTEGLCPAVQNKNMTVLSSIRAADSEGNSNLVDQKAVLPTGEKICQYWVAGNCVQGDKCQDLHSWFSGSGFYLLKKLERHNKAVTGIALPSGFDKLFSGCKDGSACVWDCNSGECVRDVSLGAEIGCMISESPWVFVGSQNAVHAWNIDAQTEIVLNGPNGLVNAMVVGDDILFAGVEDGSILAWKSSSESSCPKVLGTLTGHTLAVTSLVVGAGRLYSGSEDETIRVWNLKTFECMQALKAHADSVTSLICWDRYLFSGSLDKMLKVWGEVESGVLELVRENKQESGILALCGTLDGKANPILLCSCKDNSVIYELPSFTKRGTIFSKGEVFALEKGCGGLFFTGNTTGQLSVWKLED